MVTYGSYRVNSQDLIVNSPLQLLHTSLVTRIRLKGQIKKQFLPDTFLIALNIQVLRIF